MRQVFSSWSNILIRSASWEERVRSISLAHHKIIMVSHPLVTTGSPRSASERLNSKLSSLPRVLFTQPADCRLTVTWGSDGKALRVMALSPVNNEEHTFHPPVPARVPSRCWDQFHPTHWSHQDACVSGLSLCGPSSALWVLGTVVEKEDSLCLCSMLELNL